MLSMQASAQDNKTTDKCMAGDAVLLSQSRVGNNMVSRYLVKEKCEKSFSVWFTMSSSTVEPGLGGNAAQMTGLDDFMAQLRDTSMHVTSISVMGYSSPDGNEADNITLAAKRAAAVKAYIVSKYKPSLNVNVASRAYVWKDCIPAVQSSAIGNKGDVLKILNGNWTEMQKEQSLMKLPDAWSYLKTNILPKMRCAVVSISYTADKIVEKSAAIPQPKPAPAATPAQPQQQEPMWVVEEEEVIVATPRERKHRDGDRDRKHDRKHDKKHDKKRDRHHDSEHDGMHHERNGHDKK